MRLTRGALFMLLPAVVVFVALLVLPITTVLEESFKEFVPGRIGSAVDAPYTLDNYLELASRAYAGFFLQTYWLGLVAAALSLVIAFPMAYLIARLSSRFIRRASIIGLVGLMFLSALVRVYSLELTFGSTGILKPLLAMVGWSANSRTYIDALVVAGLLHYTVPMSALVLIGTIQNLNPRLIEAAQALGAARWKAHLTVTLPLSRQGLLSAFLVSYTIGISAFVIPWILGKGRVLFVSNLIYSRFSEVANYPSGAAISIVMLLLSILVVYAISRAAAPRKRES